MGPAWETGAPGGDGRIPFTFRIGVTGHRELADPDALRAAIRKAQRGLIELLPVASAAGLTPVVVSALAEGADRLVAEEILADPEARLGGGAAAASTRTTRRTSRPKPRRKNSAAC